MHIQKAVQNVKVGFKRHQLGRAFCPRSAASNPWCQETVLFGKNSAKFAQNKSDFASVAVFERGWFLLGMGGALVRDFQRLATFSCAGKGVLPKIASLAWEGRRRLMKLLTNTILCYRKFCLEISYIAQILTSLLNTLQRPWLNTAKLGYEMTRFWSNNFFERSRIEQRAKLCALRSKT